MSIVIEKGRTFWSSLCTKRNNEWNYGRLGLLFVISLWQEMFGIDQVEIRTLR